MVDWSALSVDSGFPFQRASTERRVEVACPKTAHTQRPHGRGQILSARPDMAAIASAPPGGALPVGLLAWGSSRRRAARGPLFDGAFLGGGFSQGGL